VLYKTHGICFDAMDNEDGAVAMAEPIASKKRSYDAAFKLKVVEYAEKSTNRGTGRKFNVDEKRIREWRKQKSSLESLPSKKKRLEGGGSRRVAWRAYLARRDWKEEDGR